MAAVEKQPPRTAARNNIAAPSIGQYLIRRLQDFGIHDVFGIPGDYILNFYTMLTDSPINVVGCTREDCAGYAADAYARVHGMGAVCVTYCVGGLSVANSIAGAYAEKSPVVLITGSPGLKERVNNPLLHHKVRDFHTQYDVFEKLCVAGTELIDAANAFREIDRVLDVRRVKRPVYIEFPRDMVDVIPPIVHTFQNSKPEVDENVLEEAIDEAVRLLNNCQRPLILAGVEIHRFGLQDQLVALAEGAGIPMAATILGKSVVSERHPLYIGLYEAAMGRADVTRYIEDSDCLLMLGTFMTDLNMGIWTARLDPGKCIYATSETLRIHHHHYLDVPLSVFLKRLIERKPMPPRREIPDSLRDREVPFKLEPAAPITISRMIARLNQITEPTIVIADIGDALFSAIGLVTHGRTEFISPAYYTSMGFAVPATLGVQVLARPDRRVVCIVGDGAFQMTGMELSNIVRRGFAPIVIVLDNGGYGTERFLHPGEHAFNAIQPWNYAKLPEILGGGTGYDVHTEGEFDAALSKAWADTSAMSLIQVRLDHNDSSQALRRLAERLSKHV